MLRGDVARLMEGSDASVASRVQATSRWQGEGPLWESLGFTKAGVGWAVPVDEPWTRGPSPQPGAGRHCWAQGLIFDQCFHRASLGSWQGALEVASVAQGHLLLCPQAHGKTVLSPRQVWRTWEAGRGLAGAHLGWGQGLGSTGPRTARQQGRAAVQ